MTRRSWSKSRSTKYNHRSSLPLLFKSLFLYLGFLPMRVNPLPNDPGANPSPHQGPLSHHEPLNTAMTIVPTQPSNQTTLGSGTSRKTPDQSQHPSNGSSPFQPFPPLISTPMA
ncbi:hypothetical protein CRG98_018327 [Punica granatum]|uniref:Uncharacterized protein n=1 Tax=Punica granatum TaxID=22663 RepID=A0A2I0JZK3_PUNGR|nr:hypothetical protein CRG98_018327 [Punica granatum]